MMATLCPSPREKRHASSNSGDGLPLVPVPGSNTVVLHADDCMPAVALGDESLGNAAGSASGWITAPATGAATGDSASSAAAATPPNALRARGASRVKRVIG
ncbi:Uncharacterised protein [Mycobacteroides abscessus subsp. massiliense]|nr:Uncharacterised protein [Mycobacteroides abscessus subsp. massiliense]